MIALFQVAHFLKADHAPWSTAYCELLSVGQPPHQPHINPGNHTEPFPIDAQTAIASCTAAHRLAEQHISIIDAVLSSQEWCCMFHATSLNQVLAETPAILRRHALAAHLRKQDGTGLLDLSSTADAVGTLRSVAQVPELQGLILRSPFIRANLHEQLQQIGPYLAALPHVSTLCTLHFGGVAAANVVSYARSMPQLKQLTLHCKPTPSYGSRPRHFVDGSGVLLDLAYMTGLTALELQAPALMSRSTEMFVQLICALLQLKDLKYLKLKGLTLKATHNNDITMSHLGAALAGGEEGGPTALTSLELAHYQPAGSAVRHCSNVTSLRELVLKPYHEDRHTWFDLHVGNFPALTNLSLCSFKLSEEHAQWLATNLRKLTVLAHLALDRMHFSPLTAGIVGPVVAELTQLRVLSVTGPYSFSGAALAQIQAQQQQHGHGNLQQVLAQIQANHQAQAAAEEDSDANTEDIEAAVAAAGAAAAGAGADGGGADAGAGADAIANAAGEAAEAAGADAGVGAGADAAGGNADADAGADGGAGAGGEAAAQPGAAVVAGAGAQASAGPAEVAADAGADNGAVADAEGAAAALAGAAVGADAHEAHVVQQAQLQFAQAADHQNDDADDAEAGPEVAAGNGVGAAAPAGDEPQPGGAGNGAAAAGEAEDAHAGVDMRNEELGNIIAKAIRPLKQLKGLVLSDMRMGGHAYKADESPPRAEGIAGALALAALEHTALQKLDIGNLLLSEDAVASLEPHWPLMHHLGEVDLTGSLCSCGAAARRSLLASLSCLTGLRALLLCCNMLGSDGAAALAPTLRQCTMLTELSLTQVRTYICDICRTCHEQMACHHLPSHACHRCRCKHAGFSVIA